MSTTTTTMMMMALLLLADLACYWNAPVVSAFQPVSPIFLRRHAIRKSMLIIQAIPVLKDWKILPNGRLEGIIVSHPEWQAGSIVSTSPLRYNPEDAAAEGKQVILVETISGSQYILLNKDDDDDDRLRPSTYPAIEPASASSPTNSYVVLPPQPAVMTTTTTSYENAIRASSDDVITSYSSSNPPNNPESFLATDPVPASWGWNSNFLVSDETASWGWDNKKKEQPSDNKVTSPAVGWNRENEVEKERVGSSTTKKLMQQVKDAGIAGIVSYALWELGFWTVSIPVCIGAYKEVTGHWPALTSQEELQKLGAGAFAFVTVARLAVPLRLGLALSTTPWVEENIVERFLSKPSKENKER